MSGLEMFIITSCLYRDSILRLGLLFSLSAYNHHECIFTFFFDQPITPLKEWITPSKWVSCLNKFPKSFFSEELKVGAL